MKKRTALRVRIIESAALGAIVLSLFGAVWYGIHSSQVANTAYGEARQVAGVPSIALAAKAITISNSSGWQVVDRLTGSSHCAASVGSSTFSTCIDSTTLIPSNETYTNQDQFTVLVSIYKHATTSFVYRFVKDGSHGGFATSDASFTSFSGKAGQIARGEKTYISDPNGVVQGEEIDLEYGIVSSNYDILITSRPFIGTHYSYTNTAGIDYRTYIPKIDALVKSITIN